LAHRKSSGWHNHSIQPSSLSAVKSRKVWHSISGLPRLSWNTVR